MLSAYKFFIHAIFALLYGGICFFALLGDFGKVDQPTKIFQVFSGLCFLSSVVILIVACCSKKKKYYYCLLIPTLAQFLLNHIYSDIIGVGYALAIVLGISSAIFYVLMFIKLKNRGSVWNTLI